MSTPWLSSVLELKLKIGRWLQLVRLFRSRRFRRNLKACGLSAGEFLRSMSHSVRYLRQCERRPDPYPVVVVDGFLDVRMMTLVSQSFPLLKKLTSLSTLYPRHTTSYEQGHVWITSIILLAFCS